MDHIDGWAVYEELAAKSWSELTDAQQALVVIGELRTEINNGGFDQYFFNGSGDHALLARDVAARCGPHALAELLERAVAELGPLYSPSAAARQAALTDAATEPDFEALDDEYFQIETSDDLDHFMTLLAAQSLRAASRQQPSEALIEVTTDDSAPVSREHNHGLPLMSERMKKAVWNGDVASIAALVSAGEDVNWTDRFGYSPLMLAVENQQAASVAALISAGADLSYSRDNGWTALHNAVDSVCDGEVQTGEPADGRIVELLLDAGADVSATWFSRSELQTPIDIARRYDCGPIVRILER